MLISFGYPPFWIKSDEAKKYYQYIADIQAYGGSEDLFFEYIIEMILRSQKLILSAIDGKDILELEDIDKKLALLEQELEMIAPEKHIKVRLDERVLNDIFNAWLSDLIKDVVFMTQKFNKFFTGTNHVILLGNTLENRTDIYSFINEEPNQVVEDIEDKLNQAIEHKRFYFHSNFEVAVQARYGAFIKGGLNTFGCNYGIKIVFDSIKYQVWVDEFSETENQPKKMLFERLLHRELTEEERKKIAIQLGETIYEHIDYFTKKNGIR